MSDLVCRNCREPIRTTHPFETLPYRHMSGFFTCFGNASSIADPADLRWEKVYASIKKDPVYENQWWFQIEVVYKGQRHHAIQLIDEVERAQVRVPADRFILDSMVKELDKSLDSVDNGL